MKKIRLTCGILAFSVLLSLTSCQKDEAIAPGIEATEFAAADFQLADLESPDVTIASETHAFGIHNDRKANTHSKTQDSHTLGFILRQLNLDQTQRKAIRGFLEAQAACVSEHRPKVKERHEELLKRANLIREEYVKAYQAGRITKAELEVKLTNLRERLKGQLQNDEQKQMRMRIMQKCRTDLMAKIASVLNREQLQKFNRWRESLK